MLFPAVPRGPPSLQARAVNSCLRTSPCFFSSRTYSSARGARGIVLSRPLSAPAPSSVSLSFLNPLVAVPYRTFSSSVNMASKIDGTAIAKSIRQGLKTEIEQIQVTNPRFKPNLVIFQGKHLYTLVVDAEENLDKDKD